MLEIKFPMKIVNFSNFPEISSHLMLSQVEGRVGVQLPPPPPDTLYVSFRPNKTHLRKFTIRIWTENAIFFRQGHRSWNKTRTSPSRNDSIKTFVRTKKARKLIFRQNSEFSCLFNFFFLEKVCWRFHQPNTFDVILRPSSTYSSRFVGFNFKCSSAIVLCHSFWDTLHNKKTNKETS